MTLLNLPSSSPDIWPRSWCSSCMGAVVPVGHGEVDLPLEHVLVDADVSLHQIFEGGEICQDDLAAKAGKVYANKTYPAAQIKHAPPLQLKGSFLSEKVESLGKDHSLHEGYFYCIGGPRPCAEQKIAAFEYADNVSWLVG